VLQTIIHMKTNTDSHRTVNIYNYDRLIGWSLTSLFSTNTAISETNVIYQCLDKTKMTVKTQ